MSASTARDWRGASIALGGGGIVVAGAMLPWMTLFAGIDRYPGVAGLYGRLALAGGALAIVAGCVLATRPARALRAAIGSLGIALVGFAGWLISGLLETTRSLGGHPFIIARPGPGVFVMLAGALVLAVLLLPQHMRIRR